MEADLTTCRFETKVSQAMIRNLAGKIRALHRDEQGAEMLEYVLVFAAIALPLLGVVIWFWEDIAKWAGDLWEDAKTGEGTDPSTL